jgi:hypothetical protein
MPTILATQEATQFEASWAKNLVKPNLNKQVRHGIAFCSLGYLGGISRGISV